MIDNQKKKKKLFMGSKQRASRRYQLLLHYFHHSHYISLILSLLFPYRIFCFLDKIQTSREKKQKAKFLCKDKRVRHTLCFLLGIISRSIFSENSKVPGPDYQPQIGDLRSNVSLQKPQLFSNTPGLKTHLITRTQQRKLKVGHQQISPSLIYLPSFLLYKPLRGKKKLKQPKETAITSITRKRN